MKIQNVNDASSLVNLVKDLISTREGILTLLFVVVITASVIVIRKDSKHIEHLREEKMEALRQVSLADERIAKTRAECVEMMQQYFSFFNEVGSQFSEKINTIQSIEKKSNAAIRQQNEIIKKRLEHDEEEEDN